MSKGFGMLTSLQTLDLSASGIEALPESFGMLTSLKELQLGGCKALGSLPESFGNLAGLQELNMLCCSSLGSLPNSESRHSESFYFLIFDVQRVRTSGQPAETEHERLQEAAESSCK